MLRPDPHRASKAILNKFFKNKSYFALNPTKELVKLKRNTIIGYSGDTFVTSYRYEENDILIPSVMTIDDYTTKKIAYNHYNQRKESVINNFKESQTNAVGQSNKLTLINRDIGFYTGLKFDRTNHACLKIAILCDFAFDFTNLAEK